MNDVFMDIETYSSVVLKDSGVYPYVESPDFEVMLISYSVDGGPVQTVDLASGESLPQEIVSALTDPTVRKWAHNAQFERICLSRFLGLKPGCYLPPEQWFCTMVWAATLGLPPSLADVGNILGLEQQKYADGKSLVRFFAQPCKPTKANGGRTRNLPDHAPDKYARYRAYNNRDTEVGVAIKKALERFPVPDFVWAEYHLDQHINDRGILVDAPFVHAALRMNARSEGEAMTELKRITGLANPNSISQLKTWLADHGVVTESMDKDAVAGLLGSSSGDARTVLELRRDISKTSVKKYMAMINASCADGRVRGMFQFYGAQRTGRFAGRLVQFQNLARNELDRLDEARELVLAGSFNTIKEMFGSVPDVLSQLVRTAFVPVSGKKLIVADYSAIEARVLAWLSGEEWRLALFREGGDIYCQSASKMFGVPVVKHGPNGHLRSKGKVAELACGYGGSVGALIAMGALNAGLKEEELQGIVNAWRYANQKIVKLWWDIDTAVKEAVANGKPGVVRGIKIFRTGGWLFITLPSGRNLAYPKPEIGVNRFGGKSVTFMGLDEQKRWSRIESYGPKFVENITQAVSRDLLCHTMRSLPRVVTHVHDEVICEVDPDVTVDFVCTKMAETPEWAHGLPLKAEGFETSYYRKD